MKGSLQACLTACALIGCLAQTMRYSDIEMLGMENCPELDSCRFIRPGNFTGRNCECDDRCALYNDCCIDAPAASNVARSRVVCMPFGVSYLGAYMVATCPEGSDRSLVDKCQGDDFSDPFLSTPVTDTRSRRSYLNSYCAQCNGASPRLEPWIIGVQCPGMNNYTWADVTRGTDGWVVRGNRCYFHVDMPPGLRNGPRLCRAKLVDNCPPKSRRTSNAKACDVYLSAVMGKDQVVYRNPHCALCNGNTVDDLSCFLGTITVSGRRPFSFALLLDVNRSDGDIVGATNSRRSCSGGQKFDPFSNQCRTVFCAIPGYTMSNGRCVKK